MEASQSIYIETQPIATQFWNQPEHIHYMLDNGMLPDVWSPTKY